MNGLVYGYYINQDTIKEIKNISEFTSYEFQTTEFVWFHFDSSEGDTKKWFSNEHHIPKMVGDALLSDNSRPRYLKFPQGILFTLRGLNLNPESDIEDMVHLNIWVEKNRIISVRSEKVYTMDDLASLYENQMGPKNKAEFLLQVITGLTKRISDYTSKLDDVMDDLEENVLNNHFDLRKKLIELRREVIIIRRYVIPQRDMLLMFFVEKFEWITEEHTLYFRELAEHTARLVEELDSIRDRASILGDEINNLRSEQMNKTMYILTLVGSIFLPLSFFSGLFGVNLGGIPGAVDHHAFLFFSLIMVVIAVIEYIIFKVNKWI